eukprot:CFRG1676T1
MAPISPSREVRDDSQNNGFSTTGTNNASLQDANSLLVILQNMCKDTTIPWSGDYSNKYPPVAQNQVHLSNSAPTYISLPHTPNLTRYRSSSLIPVPIANQDNAFSMPNTPRLAHSPRSVSKSVIRFDSLPDQDIKMEAAPKYFSGTNNGLSPQSLHANITSKWNSPVENLNMNAHAYEGYLAGHTQTTTRTGVNITPGGDGLAKSQSLSDLSQFSSSSENHPSSMSEAAVHATGVPELYLPTSHPSLLENHISCTCCLNQQSHVDDSATANCAGGYRMYQHTYPAGVEYQNQFTPRRASLGMCLPRTPAFPLSQNKLQISRVHTPAAQRQKNKARRPSVRRLSAGLHRAYLCPVEQCTRRYEAWRSLQYHLKQNHHIQTKLIQGQILATRKDSQTERDITRDITDNLIMTDHLPGNLKGPTLLANILNDK